MPDLWFVLWFYSAVGWGFHGVTLTSGWAAVSAADDKVACEQQRDRIRLYPGLHAIMCLPAGARPNGRIAEEALPWRPY